MNNQSAEKELYDQLSLYTLGLGDSSFIHQYIVDAYCAQHADSNTKPIALAFALIGLYLHMEKGFNGKEVQGFHMYMSREKREWPNFELPERRGEVTLADVLKFPPGLKRNEMIDQWCQSVWDAWRGERQKVIALAKEELNLA